MALFLTTARVAVRRGLVATVGNAVKQASVTAHSQLQFYSDERELKYLIVETVGEKKNVGLIRLNRPKALNALCSPLMVELSQILNEFEADKNIGCTIITGSEKAFAAGADIKEMVPKTFTECYKEDYLADWTAVAGTRKRMC